MFEAQFNTSGFVPMSSKDRGWGSISTRFSILPLLPTPAPISKPKSDDDDDNDDDEDDVDDFN